MLGSLLGGRWPRLSQNPRSARPNLLVAWGLRSRSGFRGYVFLTGFTASSSLAERCFHDVVLLVLRTLDPDVPTTVIFNHFRRAYKNVWVAALTYLPGR